MATQSNQARKSDADILPIFDLTYFPGVGAWPEGIFGELNAQFNHQHQHTEAFIDLLMKDAPRAVKSLEQFIETTHNESDGEIAYFVEDKDQSFLKAIGAIYPGLDDETKKQALSQAVHMFDNSGVLRAREYVQNIDEPLLIADIRVKQKIYAPGYKEYADMVKKYKTWAEFAPQLTDVKSRGLLAMAVGRPKYATSEIRTKFGECLPVLVERTQTALAKIIDNEARSSAKTNMIPYEVALQQLLGNYDTIWRHHIEQQIGNREPVFDEEQATKNLSL